jgi:hypothetical protein
VRAARADRRRGAHPGEGAPRRARSAARALRRHRPAARGDPRARAGDRSRSDVEPGAARGGRRPPGQLDDDGRRWITTPRSWR